MGEIRGLRQRFKDHSDPFVALRISAAERELWKSQSMPTGTPEMDLQDRCDHKVLVEEAERLRSLEREQRRQETERDPLIWTEAAPAVQWKDVSFFNPKMVESVLLKVPELKHNNTVKFTAMMFLLLFATPNSMPKAAACVLIAVKCHESGQLAHVTATKIKKEIVREDLLFEEEAKLSTQMFNYLNVPSPFQLLYRRLEKSRMMCHMHVSFVNSKVFKLLEDPDWLSQNVARLDTPGDFGPFVAALCYDVWQALLAHFDISEPGLSLDCHS